MSGATHILLGWSITINPRRIYLDPPTTIRMHKLGSPDAHWFTPDELRRFAASLAAIADRAEEESK